MLEPRRLAARAAAEQMAKLLNEPIGQTVGYRIRGEQKTSSKTRIEVVTEGILTRMLQDDPELSGIDVVIFDEFHERSIHADLGLALCLEVQDALREDLRLLVMSATLETDTLSRFLNEAPVITSQGRSYEIETRWRDRPLPKHVSLEQSVTELTLQALEQTEGGVLVFLPGEREIRQVAKLLTPSLGKEVAVFPLYGALPFKEQQKAIQPYKEGRKVVLATSIAETSLTIQDISVVVDGGKSRRPVFDYGSGMTRLVTEQVSRHEATQRQGRAGRVRAGICYKNWSKAEEGARPLSAPAEIESADLTQFALELAKWGAKPEDLRFLTPPKASLYAQALAILKQLGALDRSGKLTAHGQKLSSLPVHPRLAHMLALAGHKAVDSAAILQSQDPFKQNAQADFMLRLAVVQDTAAFNARYGLSYDRGVLAAIRQEAKRLKSRVEHKASELSAAQCLALAYPDRIAQRRNGSAQRYVLSGGSGAYLASDEDLGEPPFLVIPKSTDGGKEARIRLAVAITRAEIIDIFEHQIEYETTCEWSERQQKVIAEQREQLGALRLAKTKWKEAPKEALARAMLEGVRKHGLFLSAREHLFLARLQAAGAPYSQYTEAYLEVHLEDWLLASLDGIVTLKQYKELDKLPALQSLFDWAAQQRLNESAPEHFLAPSGRRILIDYSKEQPEISLKLQEMFGQTSHPKIGQTALRVTLLSPAGRPLQTTTDIAGFWKTSYFDVRKDMRGRYPKHNWPENPLDYRPSFKSIKSKKNKI